MTLRNQVNFMMLFLIHLGLKKVSTAERMIAYAHSNDPHEVKFLYNKTSK